MRGAPRRCPSDINAAADASPLRTLDAEAERAMIARIDAAKREGNTLGGICEVVVDGLPVGLGSHVSWDRKLDGRLGSRDDVHPRGEGLSRSALGFEMPRAHRRRGARRDRAAIRTSRSRATSGVASQPTPVGLEGGMTTGEPLVVRVAMKPISTLMRPLATVDVATGEPAAAVAERSDVTAVPAMGVIAEGDGGAWSLPTPFSRSSAATP